MNLIQQIYINADQPTKYAIDLLKSNYDLSKPSELLFYSMVVLTLSQYSKGNIEDWKANITEAYQLVNQKD